MYCEHNSYNHSKRNRIMTTPCYFVLQTMAFAYISIFFVILFVVGFATGPGSIPWFFVNELFNQSARPMAASLAVVTNWTANFLVALSFEPMRVSKRIVNKGYIIKNQFKTQDAKL